MGRRDRAVRPGARGILQHRAQRGVELISRHIGERGVDAVLDEGGVPGGKAPVRTFSYHSAEGTVNERRRTDPAQDLAALRTVQKSPKCWDWGAGYRARAQSCILCALRVYHMRKLQIPRQAFQRRSATGRRANVGDESNQVALGCVQASEGLEGACVALRDHRFSLLIGQSLSSRRPIHR